MKRTFDQAFTDLRRALQSWKQEGAKPGIRVFVYPPEWEPRMPARFPAFVEEMAAILPLALVDVGQGFLDEVEKRKGFEERLAAVEVRSTTQLLGDLGELGQRYLTRLLATPLEPPCAGRLLMNTGSLATFVSYSAITNALHGDGPSGTVAAPTILAFPGEGDERQLNLLGLRADTNYRVPRI